MVIVIGAALTVLIVVTVVGGIAALPLAVGGFAVIAALVLVFKALVRWFSGEPTVRG